MRILNFLILLIFLQIVLMSCTTSSPHNRGSLSDAMDKARDDSDDRSVPDQGDEDWDPWENADEIWGSWDDDNDNTSEEEDIDYEYSGEPMNIMLLLRGGQSYISGPYFNSPWEGEILLGGGSGNVEFYFYGGMKYLEVKMGNSISQSIKKNPVLLLGGGEIRYYPREKLNYISPYVLGRVGGMLLIWSFENPLESEDDVISSDSLGGISLETGIGIDFYKGEKFRIGTQLMPQAYIFGIETSEGFSNDVFDAYGTVRWTLEAGFMF